MRLTTSVLGAALAIAFTAPASASVLISYDKGGQIGAYVARYQKVRQSGERVVINGACLSACTIVVGMIPRDRLCAMPNAVLGFHAAWFPDGAGGMRPSHEATQVLMRFYTPGIRQWIARRGGLTPQLMLLQGRELAALVPPCGAAGAPMAERGGSGVRSAQARSAPRARATIAPPPSAEAAIAR
jgi:hypothetical protein